MTITSETIHKAAKAARNDKLETSRAALEVARALGKEPTEPDDFCAWGERREDR